jgi:hypothetical protein
LTDVRSSAAARRLVGPVGHGSLRSSAAPNGPDGRPWLSRQSVADHLDVSLNWIAIDNTIAASRSRRGLCGLIEQLADEPSGYRPIVRCT